MRVLCVAALLLFLRAVPAVSAGTALPLGLSSEAILIGLGPLSCRADLPDDSPLKKQPCEPAELLDYGVMQQSKNLALTALAECLPGDKRCWYLMMLSATTRRAIVSKPGAEITLTQIISQPAQYTGWRTGRLSPATIAAHLTPAMYLAEAFIRGDYDSEPLRFTHYALSDPKKGGNPSWMRKARKAGIKILSTDDGHDWITGTPENPALIYWRPPKGASRSMSWRRVRDSAPAMFAAIHGPRTMAGLAILTCRPLPF